jgi:hypothetical protein
MMKVVTDFIKAFNKMPCISMNCSRYEQAVCQFMTDGDFGPSSEEVEDP